MAEQPKVSERASEKAKMIWQAGLGAYGRALEGVEDQVGKVSKETSKFFDDLVEKGKKLEDPTQKRFSGARRKSTMTIDERIAKVRQSLGLDASRDAQLDELVEKLDGLSERLDELIDLLHAQGRAPRATRAGKPRSAKKTSKKTTKKPTRKTAKKKAAKTRARNW